MTATSWTCAHQRARPSRRSPTPRRDTRSRSGWATPSRGSGLSTTSGTHGTWSASPARRSCAIERSIELGREARTGLELESQSASPALAERGSSAGDRAGALEAAEESVPLARERGNEAMLAFCYRVCEALAAQM